MKELFKIMQNKPHKLGLPMENFWTLLKGTRKAFSDHPIKNSNPHLAASVSPTLLHSLHVTFHHQTYRLFICLLLIYGLD